MPKYSNYDRKNLAAAIQAVNKGMSMLKASKFYNVPRSTLRFRCSSKFKKCHPGPDTVLSSSDEDTLVNWLKECVRKGFPRSKNDLRLAVKEYLDENPCDNPFTNNMPGKGWYYSFLKRHPQVVLRTPEALTAASSTVSKEDITRYFDNIENYLKENGLFDILSDPTRIFNM